jgi:hypothetical protein
VQKVEYLPRIISADILFAIAYSESDAGCLLDGDSAEAHERETEPRYFVPAPWSVDARRCWR